LDFSFIDSSLRRGPIASRALSTRGFDEMRARVVVVSPTRASGTRAR